MPVAPNPLLQANAIAKTSRSATVQAVTDVECYVIHDALQVLQTHPSWTLQIARLLAQRVNSTTAALMAAQPDRIDDSDRLILPHYVISDWSDPQV